MNKVIDGVRVTREWGSTSIYQGFYNCIAFNKHAPAGILSNSVRLAITDSGKLSESLVVSEKVFLRKI